MATVASPPVPAVRPAATPPALTLGGTDALGENADAVIVGVYAPAEPPPAADAGRGRRRARASRVAATAPAGSGPAGAAVVPAPGSQRSSRPWPASARAA